MRPKSTSFDSLKSNGGFKGSAGTNKRHRFDLSGTSSIGAKTDSPGDTHPLPTGGNQGYTADDGVVSIPDSEMGGDEDHNDTMEEAGPSPAPMIHAPGATIHIHHHPAAPARMHALKSMQKHGNY